MKGINKSPFFIPPVPSRREYLDMSYRVSSTGSMHYWGPLTSTGNASANQRF